MALKNVERITFSLPKTTIRKLELAIPKNSRSKFIAELIEQNLNHAETITMEQVDKYWDGIAALPKLSLKSAVDLIREDRTSH